MWHSGLLLEITGRLPRTNPGYNLTSFTRLNRIVLRGLAERCLFKIRIWCVVSLFIVRDGFGEEV